MPIDEFFRSPEIRKFDKHCYILYSYQKCVDVGMCQMKDIDPNYNTPFSVFTNVRESNE